jgi:hypothetical protein
MIFLNEKITHTHSLHQIIPFQISLKSKQKHFD